MIVPPAVATAGPSRVRIWFHAIRFFSFTASVVPILVGAALAIEAGRFGWIDLPLALTMLLASIACHAGANLTNDYHDHRRGIDTADSLGPSKVIQQGLLSPAEVRRGMIVAFAFATGLGLIVVAAGGWTIFWLALASLAIAYLYTGGPRPLGYLALGEVAVFLAMGPGMVLGTLYVLAHELSPAAVLISLAVGSLVAAFVHANNLRDIEPDRAAGKITLATLLGRKRANVEYALLIGGAFLATLTTIALDRGLRPLLAVLLMVPVARGLLRIVFSPADERALNSVVRRTAGLHLRFGLLLVAGLLLATILDRMT